MSTTSRPTMRALAANLKNMPTQASITQFTKVEKSSAFKITAKDVATSSSRKRTFAAIMDSEDEEEQVETVTDKPSKRSKLGPEASTEEESFNHRPNPQSLPTPECTPQKPTRYKDCLEQPTNKQKDDTSNEDQEVEVASEDDGESEARSASIDLPAELQDIISLQSAFIRALTLHYTHHGSATPVRLLTFLPSVSKVWGKRAVTVLDVQRCLGSMRSNKFVLYDYGRDQICLELDDNTSITNMFNMHNLDKSFAATLESAWRVFQEPFPSHLNQADTDEIELFIKTLPLHLIKPSPTLGKLAPLFLKGQRRLDMLTKPSSSSATASAPSSASPAIAKAKSTTAVLSRSNSLLERLKAKEKANANAPAAPTRANLERKAALQRLPDVVSMLCMLRAARSSSAKKASPRQTFSLQSLIQRIQDSSTSCMSKEEVERCIFVLAEEVAKDTGFVEMVGTGRIGGGAADEKKGLMAVVVDASKVPSEMTRRIKEAMEKKS